MYRSMSTLESSSQIAFIRDEDQRPICGKMSASRRTFCLLVTFDLIMTFILWGVYVKVSLFFCALLYFIATVVVIII